MYGFGVPVPDEHARSIKRKGAWGGGGYLSMNEYRAPEPTMIPSNFYMSADRRTSALRHRHGQIIVYSCVIRSRCNNPINMDVFLLRAPAYCDMSGDAPITGRRLPCL